MDVGAARIAQLSEYFDALADLVPFKHYVDTDDYVDVRSMKQKERVQIKATFKQQHKVAKRAKLDPDAEVSTTKAQRDVGSDRDQNGAAPLAPWLTPANAGGHDDLKERLTSKIQTMREQRKAEERKQTAAKAQAWKQKQHEAGLLAGKKHKRKAPDGRGPPGPQNSQPKASEAVDDNGGDIMFNRLQVQDGRNGAKKRKLSKTALLKQAEAQGAAADNGELPAGEVAMQSWKKMMDLAKGEKILDDPMRLRKSIKKEVKDKQKKAAVWQERNEAMQKKQVQRQERRTANLQQRVDKKQAKKKAKREARFLGAGFEGRTPALRGAGAAAASS
eukprot:jgi/Ulvmu1/602/UM001_0610.1